MRTDKTFVLKDQPINKDRSYIDFIIDACETALRCIDFSNQPMKHEYKIEILFSNHSRVFYDSLSDYKNHCSFSEKFGLFRLSIYLSPYKTIKITHLVILQFSEIPTDIKQAFIDAFMNYYNNEKHKFTKDPLTAKQERIRKVEITSSLNERRYQRKSLWVNIVIAIVAALIGGAAGSLVTYFLSN